MGNLGQRTPRMRMASLLLIFSLSPLAGLTNLTAATYAAGMFFQKSLTSANWNSVGSSISMIRRLRDHRCPGQLPDLGRRRDARHRQYSFPLRAQIVAQAADGSMLPLLRRARPCGRTRVRGAVASLRTSFIATPDCNVVLAWSQRAVKTSDEL